MRKRLAILYFYHMASLLSSVIYSLQISLYNLAYLVYNKATLYERSLLVVLNFRLKWVISVWKIPDVIKKKESYTCCRLIENFTKFVPESVIKFAIGSGQTLYFCWLWTSNNRCHKSIEICARTQFHSHKRTVYTYCNNCWFFCKSQGNLFRVSYSTTTPNSGTKYNQQKQNLLLWRGI